MEINSQNLKEFLLDGKLISEKQFDDALKKSEKTKQKISDILISDGLVTEEQIASVKAYISGIPFINIENEINKAKSQTFIQDYRLPVLEEWCYAASNCEPSKRTPEPEIRDVKYYKERKMGLSNISGNVSEWSCSDNSDLSEKYVMGGSWKDSKGIQDRSKIDINTKSGLVGFRIVRSYLGKDFNK